MGRRGRTGCRVWREDGCFGGDGLALVVGRWCGLKFSDLFELLPDITQLAEIQIRDIHLLSFRHTGWESRNKSGGTARRRLKARCNRL